MNTPSFNDLTDALSTPVGDLIASIGGSLADAQHSLDAATIDNFKSIYSEDNDAYEALRKIGYQPTWYQIPELNAEISVALTVSGTSEVSGKQKTTHSQLVAKRKLKNKIQLYATPVDATFTNKYGFDYTASSKINFKIVPIPPSSSAEGMKIAPKIIGLTYTKAVQLLQELNIDYVLPIDFKGAPKPAQKVKGQSVSAGEIIRLSDTFMMTL